MARVRLGRCVCMCTHAAASSMGVAWCAHMLVASRPSGTRFKPWCPSVKLAVLDCARVGVMLKCVIATMSSLRRRWYIEARVVAREGSVARHRVHVHVRDGTLAAQRPWPRAWISTELQAGWPLGSMPPSVWVSRGRRNALQEFGKSPAAAAAHPQRVCACGRECEAGWLQLAWLVQGEVDGEVMGGWHRRGRDTCAQVLDSE